MLIKCLAVFHFLIIFFCRLTAAEAPKFFILAPPFVCPEDKEAVMSRPENTVITIQTEASSTVEFQWTVRWVPLPASTQRMTVMLWRSVRELEKHLNGAQAEPNTFVIKNAKLLPGVKYIFNVTGRTFGEVESTFKSFHIDNIKGDKKILIEGRSDMFAILLVGSQQVYPDMQYEVEAQVTSCQQTQDYCFVWMVETEEDGDTIDVSDVKGSRLEVPKNTLKSGVYYNVVSRVQKYTTGEVITQASIPVRTLTRDLMINLNVDYVVVPVDKPFTLKANVHSIENLTLTWDCLLNDEVFDTFEADSEGTINFLSGLPNIGMYSVSVSISTGYFQAAKSTVRVSTVDARLPVIQLAPVPRTINEDSVVTMSANVSGVFPGCTLTWYFSDTECLSTNASMTNNICGDNAHGTPIADPMKINSLEENFLEELTDFSNETHRVLVTVDLKAAEGKVRLVAECASVQTSNCTLMETAYAEINIKLNKKPGAGIVMISPESGTALETVFRISTLPLSDLDRPLRYSFYCKLGSNDSLLLGTYLEHLAVETFLPYVAGGTKVWVETCDSLGACSTGVPKAVEVDPGRARTLSALIEDARGHARRCEMILAQRLVMSAIETYTNSDQLDALSIFTAALREIMDNFDPLCKDKNVDQYWAIMNNYLLLNE